MHSETVDIMRLRRRFEHARDATYYVDRLSVCDYRVRVVVHGARDLRNIHLLRSGGSAYVRGVVGGAVAFETTVDLGATFPNATWDESYELGCKLGERVEVRVIDKDGGLLGGSNLGDLDLGLVDDYVSTPLTPAAEYVGSWRLVPGGRCLALKTASYEDSVRYLPLTSATGGHGSAAASVRERRSSPSATGLLTSEGR